MVKAAAKVDEATLEGDIWVQMELPAGGFVDSAPPRPLERTATVSIPLYTGENLFCWCRSFASVQGEESHGRVALLSTFCLSCPDSLLYSLFLFPSVQGQVWQGWALLLAGGNKVLPSFCSSRDALTRLPKVSLAFSVMLAPLMVPEWCHLVTGATRGAAERC